MIFAIFAIAYGEILARELVRSRVAAPLRCHVGQLIYIHTSTFRTEYFTRMTAANSTECLLIAYELNFVAFDAAFT